MYEHPYCPSEEAFEMELSHIYYSSVSTYSSHGAFIYVFESFCGFLSGYVFKDLFGYIRTLLLGDRSNPWQPIGSFFCNKSGCISYSICVFIMFNPALFISFDAVSALDSVFFQTSRYLTFYTCTPNNGFGRNLLAVG